MPGALDGIRVLEFSEIIAAPFAGQILSDMGADIVKVEPVWGEAWRLNLQVVPLESRGFMAVNRGKRSLPLDLRRPEAQEIVAKLVAETDVVLINHRPDVPPRLGIDYESLSAINPRIVYCEATAFGREGPHRLRPGYDLIAQAVTGMIATDQKMVDGVPSLYQSTPFVDFCTGTAMAAGVCAALFSRERTGRGQRLDASLLTTGLALQGLRATWIESIDAERHAGFVGDLARMRSEGRSINDALTRYNEFLNRSPDNNRYHYRVYRTTDGAIAVGCLSQPLRKRLLDALGIEGTGELANTGPTEADQEIMAKAERTIAAKTTVAWTELFDAAGVPAGPVNFAEDMWDDDQVVANGVAVEVNHTLVGKVRMTGPLVNMSGTPTQARSASPALGEHTDDILEALSYTPERIDGLRKAGVTR